MNTGTTIITFLMVLASQKSQNCNGGASGKLDELILTLQAQNKFVGIKKKLDEQQFKEMSQSLDEKAEQSRTSPRLSRREKA